MLTYPLLLMKLLYQTPTSTCFYEFQGINLENFETKVFELENLNSFCYVERQHVRAMNEACGFSRDEFEYAGRTVASVACRSHVRMDVLTSALRAKDIRYTGKLSIKSWENDLLKVTGPQNILDLSGTFQQKVKQFCDGTLYHLPCRQIATRAIVQHALTGKSKAEGRFSCFFTNIETGYTSHASITDFDDGIEIAALTKDTAYRMYTLGKNDFFELIVKSQSLKFVRFDGEKYYQALRPNCDEGICLSHLLVNSSPDTTEVEISHSMELINEMKIGNFGKIAGAHRNDSGL